MTCIIYLLRDKNKEQQKLSRVPCLKWIIHMVTNLPAIFEPDQTHILGSCAYETCPSLTETAL